MDQPVKNQRANFDNHPLCRHPSCVKSCLYGFIRGALIGLSTRFILAFTNLLIKRKLIKQWWKLGNIFKLDKLRYVIFLTLMVGLQRTGLCIFRRLTNNEGLSTVLASIFSSLSLIVEEAESRRTWALLTAVRGIESFANALVANGYLPKIPYLIEIIYVITILPVKYAIVFEPDAANRSYSNSAKRIVDFHDGEITLMEYFEKQVIKKMGWD